MWNVTDVAPAGIVAEYFPAGSKENVKVSFFLFVVDFTGLDMGL
jgi:hypothetical protein